MLRSPIRATKQHQFWRNPRRIYYDVRGSLKCFSSHFCVFCFFFTAAWTFSLQDEFTQAHFLPEGNTRLGDCYKVGAAQNTEVSEVK